MSLNVFCLPSNQLGNWPAKVCWSVRKTHCTTRQPTSVPDIEYRRDNELNRRIINNYSPKWRWTVVDIGAYTSHNCFHIFIFQIFKTILPNSVGLSPHSSFINKNTSNSSRVHLSLKSKRNIFEYCSAKFRCFFGIVWHGDFVYLKKKFFRN